MNRFKNVYLVFVVSLLFVFAGCSLMVLQFQIDSYQEIYEESQKQEAIYTPISYIQNKVRNYDKAKGVSVQEVDGITCLVFHDERMATYVYDYQGTLMELATTLDYEVDLSMGTKLFDCQQFQVMHKGNTLIVSIDGKEMVQMIHSQEGFYV